MAAVVATTERAFAVAVEHHRAGRLAQAESLYAEILAANPRHHAALFSLSLIAMQSSDNEAAAELLVRAVALAPDNYAYRANLGEAYRRLGRHQEAVEALSQAILRKPDFAEGFYNLGLVLRAIGEKERAIVSFERAADSKPELLAVQQALAHTLAECGDLDKAVGRHACVWLLSGRSPKALEALAAVLRRAGRSEAAAAMGDLDFAQASYKRACALDKRGQLSVAIPLYQRAADSRPDDLRFQRSLARALRETGELERCVAHYHCALALEPRPPDLLVELSMVLLELGRVESAVATSRRAVSLDGKHALAHATLGAGLVEQLRAEEAIASCRRAIEIDPRCSLAHLQMGIALVACGEVEQAIDAYRRAVALDPSNQVAHSNLVLLMSYAPGCDSRGILEEARAWARVHADPVTVEIQKHSNDPTPERRLRVGYVSPDLHAHPVSQFLLPLVRHHDREHFEVVAYSTGRRSDDATARIREHCDAWRDVSGVGDRVLAQSIRDDRIDVLVDLAMHTGGGRLRVFARKPAPVQICWLGHVGTTGLRQMDYRFIDRRLDPGQDPDAYGETPLALPDTIWCYEPFEPCPEVGPLPARSTGHVTFGCQHTFHKIHRGVLSLWSRVLRALPDARLVLHAPAQSHAKTLEALAQEGIDRFRVELLPRRPYEEYLRAYQKIDVCLDTFPYNGATTSLDALWMGAPVITLVGQTPVGRAGLSLLHNLGLSELVAETSDDYVRIAVDLGRDLGRLNALRDGLRARMRASSLMDAPRFARNVETAYRTAWQAWCAPAKAGTELPNEYVTKK
jgi:protein O-GlcNAc transferase